MPAIGRRNMDSTVFTLPQEDGMKENDTFDWVACMFWTSYALLIVMLITQMVVWLIY